LSTPALTISMERRYCLPKIRLSMRKGINGKTNRNGQPDCIVAEPLFAAIPFDRKLRKSRTARIKLAPVQRPAVSLSADSNTARTSTSIPHAPHQVCRMFITKSREKRLCIDAAR
jgi:hypothetical protein